MADIVNEELQLVRKCPDDWQSLVSTGIELRQMHDISSFCLGVLALKVEKKYNKDALGKFAIEISVSKVSLQQYRWVAGKILEKFTDVNISERIGNLSYSHLRTAAGTDDPEKWIEEAINKDLTCEQLALAVKGKLQEPAKKLKTQKTIKAQVCKILMEYFPDATVELIDEVAWRINEVYEVEGA